jgi:hypothetical protein
LYKNKDPTIKETLVSKTLGAEALTIAKNKKKLAKQMNGTQKKFLFLRHSVGLQGGLFDESQLPRSKGWSGSVEDEVIPLLPN